MNSEILKACLYVVLKITGHITEGYVACSYLSNCALYVACSYLSNCALYYNLITI